MLHYQRCKNGQPGVTPIFKLSKLASLYIRVKQLGTDILGHVHSTKLKDRTLSYFLQMEARTQGCKVILAFNRNVGASLKKACKNNADGNAVQLAGAASIVISQGMFNMKSEFNGSFSTD